MDPREEQKIIRMTTAPVHSIIVQLAVPSIISMLITGLYNMVDTFFVGQIGTEATAGVGLIFPMMAIMQAISFFFGQGSGNFISRALGAKNHDEAQIMASTGAVFTLIVSLVILVLGHVFMDGLLFVLGARDSLVDELTISYARDYLSIILMGAPFICLSFVLNNQMRFQGNAVFSMVALAIGAVVNCFLDPLFIFTFGLEVRGAAYATVIGQFISFVFMYIGIVKSDCLKLHFREFCPNGYYIRNIAIGGTPSLFRQTLASVSTLCLNAAAGSAVAAELADTSIAAFSISGKICFFALSMILGFAQGFQPVCGFNYGAKKYDRVLDGYLFCLRFGLVVILVLSVLGFGFSPQLIALFRDDPGVVAIGKIALRCQCVTLPFIVVLTITNIAYQSMGKVFGATLLALARQGLTFIPVVLLLPRVIEPALHGVYLSQPVADLLALCIAVPMAVKLFRTLREAQRKKDAGEI